MNAGHRGDPAHDTTDFGSRHPGNLRLDYVLPSRSLQVIATEVYWPEPGNPGNKAITASDHRLVWIDVAERE